MTKEILKIFSLLIILIFSKYGLNAQCTLAQLGIDIDGEASNNQSGYSVSLSADGLTLAIGAPRNAGGGLQRGHVRVYKNISGTWTQQGTDIDGEANSDNSGYSISLSADGLTVAIGAPFNDGNGSNSGQVRVYKLISGTWTQLGSDIDGEATSDNSGWSVSLSSDGLTVAIGATRNAGGGFQRGHVRVYKNISGTWTQQGADIDGEADDDWSGYSVSLSADGLTVAIGAIKNADGGFQSGHVRVYKNISGTWTQHGTDIDGEANNDLSGFSISLSSDGTTVAIGAPDNAGGGTYRGHVRVYKNISGTWAKQGVDLDGEADYDNSGHSISLSADGLTLAIGAVNNAGGGNLRGHVRMYKNILSTWTKQDSDIGGEANGDALGQSVSLNSDGLAVAIGAHFNDGNGSNSGHVRVYQLSCPAFEINLKGNGISIIDGDVTPRLDDSTDMGIVATGSSIKSRYYIINTGTDTLKISSIVSSGTHASEFVVSGAPTKVLKNDSAMFFVTFTPTAAGIRTATITVNNNDTNEAAYDFAVTGTGTSCTLSQLGIDIDGEATNDQSGWSVSLSDDGLTVAIGAKYNVGGGSNNGHVRVYKNISGTWTQQGADIDGEANGDQSGHSVSLSADGLTVAIGAIGNNGGGLIRGHVRVYKLINGTWTQQGSDIDGEADYDQSGWSVSLSDDGLTVAIGAINNLGGGTYYRGHVRVYKLISGTWTQQGADINGEADYDNSGWSVSLSADGLTLAIGVPFNDGNGSNSGHVRVYKYTSGTWTQQGADIDGEANFDESGYSVSLSADGLTLAIGAHLNEGGGIVRGHVRVYKNISGTWTQQGSDIDGKANLDQSGFTVSLSDDGFTVAIGAPYNDGNGSNSGHVRVYKFSSGSWVQQVSDIYGEANSDQSGYSVSLSADGLTVAIGANQNDGNGSNSGHVRVYQLSCPSCKLTSTIPNAAGTYTSTQIGVDGTYTCYCDVSNNLLLALDTTGTRAVISKDSVKLQIGSTATTSWNNAGGIITNSYGGVIFNRKWDVKPTTQPTSPVKVKFFFTQAEYDSVKTKLSAMGTTITSPTQFEMYKLFTSGFGDPHASGATGIIIMNGSTPSLNTWQYAALGSNHSAEFLVNSFSGGGGGAGAGAIPLPVEFISFTAKKASNTSAKLNWQTVSEVNNNYFEVERSLDGVNFIKIGTVNANGTNAGNYQYLDNTISIGTNKAFYRIKQVDVNGKNASTNIQLVHFGEPISTINVFPNPFNETLSLELDIQEGETANITITDAMGRVVYNNNTNETNTTLNLKELTSGIYNIIILNNENTQSFKIMKQ